MIYPISSLWLKPLIKKLTASVSGLEHVPKDKEFIIAANHISMLDPLFIIFTLLPQFHEKIHFISRPIRIPNPFLRNIVKKWSGTIPMNDDNPSACLDEALEYIQHDKIVGIFPEGVRIPIGTTIRRGKTGVIRLALKSKLPILPVGIDAPGEPHTVHTIQNIPKRLRRFVHDRHVRLTANSIISHDGENELPISWAEFEHMKKGIRSYFIHAFKYFLKTGYRFKLRFGEPISLASDYDTPITYDFLRDRTDSLMHVLGDLSGRKYNSQK